jgi:hypothetical protein
MLYFTIIDSLEKSETSRKGSPMSSIDETIDQYISRRLEYWIAELKQLCAQPSVSASGEGIDECAKLVAAVLQGHGLDTCFNMSTLVHNSL